MTTTHEKPADADIDTELARPGLPILLGLNALGKHCYGGTVDPATVADRRRRNRAARRSRRINRQRGR